MKIFKTQSTILNLKTTYLIFIITLLSQVITAQTELTLQVDTAGTLNQLITDNGKTPEEITSLTLTGELNGTDIKLLRQMAGGGNDAFNSEGFNLSYLNIEKVKIISGGEPYYAKRVNLQPPFYTIVSYYANDNIIGEYFFFMCNNLNTLLIPENSIKIMNKAFERCSKLETLSQLSDSINYIGQYAFRDCVELKSINIPKMLTTIKTSTFEDCQSLNEIFIHDNIDSVYSRAFYNCKSLKKVNIGQNVSYIAFDTFEGCYNISAFNVSYNNQHFTSEDSVFYDKKKKILIRYPPKRVQTTYNLPNSVDSICYQAFNWSENLESIIFHERITKINDESFLGCTSLSAFNIPSKVVSIGKLAFHACNNLSSITIPSTVKSISESAFNACFKLTSLQFQLPSSITSIGPFAFQNCNMLSSVELPEGITSIGEWAFSYCYSLKSTVIPKSVQQIGDYAFWDCQNLEEVYCKILSPIDIESKTFNYHGKLYVPNGTKKAYSEALYWKDFINIIEMDFFTKIKEKKNASIQVIPSNSKIIISGAKPNSIVSIYKINGTLIKKYKTTDLITEISLPRGFYIINVGNETFKYLL